jgi:RNA 3'-terminal phosphate cyclase (ATP)
MEITIDPAPALAGFDLLERGRIVGRSGRAIVANLSPTIAVRERDTLISMLSWPPASIQAADIEAQGPGNYVGVEVESEHVTEVFSGFGRTGIKAEHVAAEAAREARDYLASDAAVGPYLADQLLLPLGLSAASEATLDERRGGTFRTLPLTRHSQTHIELLERFLGIVVQCERADDGRSCLVSVSGTPFSV